MPLNTHSLRLNRVSRYTTIHPDRNAWQHIKLSIVKISKPWLTVICVSSVTVITGCAERVSVADTEMATIRASESIPIDPIPKPQLVEDYNYDSGEMRSPFLPPSLLFQQNIITQSDVAPNLNRAKELLEGFELSQLVYRGLVVSPAGKQHGLIQRPDGVVESIKVGDYMGLNDGRVVEITPSQINLVEIIPDNRAGYVEKPASIVSPI